MSPFEGGSGSRGAGGAGGGEEDLVDELLDERVVDGLEAEQHAAEDDRAGDLAEQRADRLAGRELAAGGGTLEDERPARALDVDDVLAEQAGELVARAQLGGDAGGQLGVL